MNATKCGSALTTRRPEETRDVTTAAVTIVVVKVAPSENSARKQASGVDAPTRATRDRMHTAIQSARSSRRVFQNSRVHWMGACSNPGMAKPTRLRGCGAWVAASSIIFLCANRRAPYFFLFIKRNRVKSVGASKSPVGIRYSVCSLNICSTNCTLQWESGPRTQAAADFASNFAHDLHQWTCTRQPDVQSLGAAGPRRPMIRQVAVS